MPTNQQRREAAKRKLERQLVRRVQRERQRRQRLLVVGAVAAVLVVAGVILLITTRPSGSSASSTDTSTTGTESSSAATSSTGPVTPCSYPVSGTPAKDVKPPTNLSPANTGTVDATITLNGKAVPASLNRKAAPCAVNSFVSLASQKYFDNTTCHRETASATLSVLQCGDPTGKGSGGPGYTFADELTSIPGYDVSTGSQAPVAYKRGTIAMANAGTNTNGSQFFLVYKDSTLPPSYTVFGTVSAEGLKVLDAIAAKGVSGGGEDGAPAEKVTIDSVTVPAAAVSATGSYPSTAASGSSAESPASSAESPAETGAGSSAASPAGTGAGSSSAGTSSGSASGAGSPASSSSSS